VVCRWAVTVTEREWQREVVALAKHMGWRHYHTHDSRRSEPGWPDLALVRDRLVLAELKTETGRVSAAQERWLSLLSSAGVETYLWRPSDRDEVIRVLSRRRPNPPTKQEPTK
jgi:hypothetical protein